MMGGWKQCLKFKPIRVKVKPITKKPSRELKNVPF
jgi:hypothetical protein